MKVAIVDLVFNWPPTGGSMVDIREVAVRLTQNGHEIKMFVPDDQSLFPRGKITQDPGFPIHKIPFNRYTFNYKVAPERFRKAIDQFNPDVVFFTDGYFMKPYIAQALKHYPLYWRAYAYEIFCPKINHYDYRYRRVCRSSIFLDQEECIKCFKHHFLFKKAWAKLFSMIPYRLGGLFIFQEFWFSRADREQFLDIFRSSLEICSKIIVYNERQKALFEPYNDNIVLAPTGLDSNFKKVDVPSKSSEKIVILLSGRADDPVKGYQSLIEACYFLYKDGYPIELQVTIKKDVEINDYPFLKKLGWFTPDKLPELISSSDIVVIPSLWEEAFGIVALEGMACGKPVVASRVGGLKHSVIDGETGLLFQAGNVFDLYDKLKVLLDNEKLRRKMGQAGIERVNKYFRWNHIMDTVYSKLFC